MNARSLSLTIALTLAASAAAAAIRIADAQPVNSVTIPRVVVTASRPQAVPTQVPRVVVVARRADANAQLASK